MTRASDEQRGTMNADEAMRLILDGIWDRRMTVHDLKLYAWNYCIDLGGATRRADVLELIERAVPSDV
jgi:hypothetical protein